MQITHRDIKSIADTQAKKDVIRQDHIPYFLCKYRGLIDIDKAKQHKIYICSHDGNSTPRNECIDHEGEVYGLCVTKHCDFIKGKKK